MHDLAVLPSPHASPPSQEVVMEIWFLVAAATYAMLYALAQDPDGNKTYWEDNDG